MGGAEPFAAADHKAASRLELDEAGAGLRLAHHWQRNSSVHAFEASPAQINSRNSKALKGRSSGFFSSPASKARSKASGMGATQ